MKQEGKEGTERTKRQIGSVLSVSSCSRFSLSQILPEAYCPNSLVPFVDLSDETLGNDFGEEP